MARTTFVKAARKNYPAHGIKKGDSYYWWKFRFGSKHFSKTAPRRSQLTQSEFLSTIYDIEDRISGLSTDDLEAAKSERDSIVSELQDLASECEDRLSNMPDALQYAPTGELLQSRSDECNSMADELENVDLEIEEEDVETLKREPKETKEAFQVRIAAEAERVQEEYTEKVEDAISELQGVSYSGE